MPGFCSIFTNINSEVRKLNWLKEIPERVGTTRFISDQMYDKYQSRTRLDLLWEDPEVQISGYGGPAEWTK